MQKPKGNDEKDGCFCNAYTELVFLCNGTDRHEIRENVNRCALLNLNTKILKVFS